VRDFGGKAIRQYQSSQTYPMMGWTWLEDYVYRDGLLVGAERVPEEGGRRHFHLDHLGSPRLISGALGLEAAHHDFAPFGIEMFPLWQETTNGFDREDPMRFTAHERDFMMWDPVTRPYLDYMHARYYDPNMGRFLSVDTGVDEEAAIYEPQRWNRYTYALNSPLKYVDKDGKNAAVAVGGGIIVIGGIVLIHEWEMATNPHYRKAMTDIGTSIWTIFAEHVKGARPSTAGKHEKGQRRKGQDQGGEKGDERRRPPRKRPPGHKGPWPPRGAGGDGAGNKMEFFSDTRSPEFFSDTRSPDADFDALTAPTGSGTLQFFGGQSLAVEFLLERMESLDSFWQWFDMQDPKKH
jgi:RHS repeat-associated protein